MIQLNDGVKITRKELYDLFTDRSLLKVAEDLGVQRNSLRQVSAQFNVPYRDAQDWPKINAGHHVEMVPLFGDPNEVLFVPKKYSTKVSANNSTEVDEKQQYRDQIAQKELELEDLKIKLRMAESQDNVQAMIDAICDDVRVYDYLKSFTVDKCREIGFYMAQNFEIVAELVLDEIECKKKVGKKSEKPVVTKSVVPEKSGSVEKESVQPAIEVSDETPVPEKQVIVPKVEVKVEQKPKVKNEFSVVPNGKYSLKQNVKIKKWNRPVQARVTMRDGEWILEQGSIICPYCREDDPLYEQLTALRKDANIAGNRLKADVRFESASLAAAFCVGYSIDGWNAWYDKDRKFIRVYRK